MVIGLPGVPDFGHCSSFFQRTRKDLLFSGRCSVTIFLTDLDGTVPQHDGNILAVDRFPFFDGNLLTVDVKSNFDGIFTAVTQHDGKLPAADGFRFFGAASKWPYAEHISST